MCILLASKICKRFAEGKKPYTALELKMETRLPIRIVNELLFCMTKVEILNETACRDKDDIVSFQPAECLSRLSVGMLIERMEREGNWTPGNTEKGAIKRLITETLKRYYFTVIWKQPCLTSYLTRHLSSRLLSFSTSLRIHFKESLRTLRRAGPSGSSTVL